MTIRDDEEDNVHNGDDGDNGDDDDDDDDLLLAMVRLTTWFAKRSSSLGLGSRVKDPQTNNPQQPRELISTSSSPE